MSPAPTQIGTLRRAPRRSQQEGRRRSGACMSGFRPKYQRFLATGCSLEPSNFIEDVVHRQRAYYKVLEHSETPESGVPGPYPNRHAAACASEPPEMAQELALLGERISAKMQRFQITGCSLEPSNFVSEDAHRQRDYYKVLEQSETPESSVPGP